MANRRERLRLLLGIDPPSTDLQSVLEAVGLTVSLVLSFLRNSAREEAQAILNVAIDLQDDDMPVVTIDQLMAAAGVKGQAAVETIVGAMYAQGAAVGQMVASLAQGATMARVVKEAQGEKFDFEAAKFVLQVGGTAPLPKSTVTNVLVRGNLNQTAIANLNVPRLEDVTRSVDAILEG